MFKKNGFVEVAVGPPVFIVANAPSGSPNTWSLGTTRPTESLKATPAAAATSNAVIAAMRHRLLVSFLVVRAWFEGWPFWAIGEPVWAGIEFLSTVMSSRAAPRKVQKRQLRNCRRASEAQAMHQA
jgi:hypothetical protein